MAGSFDMGEVPSPDNPGTVENEALGTLLFGTTPPFSLQDVQHLAVTYGIGFHRTLDPTTEVSRLTLELTTVDGMVAGDDPIDTLDGAMLQSWADPLSDAGGGELSFDFDDLSLNLLNLRDRQLVNFLVDGQPVWTMRVEKRHRVQVPSEDDNTQKLTVYSGRGALSLWDEGVTFPALGLNSQPVEDDRTFDWTSPEFDPVAAGWPWAKIVDYHLFAAYGTLDGGPPNWPIPWSQEYPDVSAGIMWSVDGSLTFAPNGNVFARDILLIAAPGEYIIFGLADNYCECYIDGVLVQTVTGFEGRPQEKVTLSAGFHYMAFLGVNAGGPAGFEFTIFLPGYPPTVVYRTGGIGSLFGNTMRILAYPPQTPGLTVGAVCRILLEEAQARGRLQGFSLGFTDFVDSGGNEWDFAAVSTKVGQDYYTVLKEMSETYADFAMRPGTLILDGWNKDTKGTLVGVDLFEPTDETDQASGNLLSLEADGEKPGATSLLIRWQGGWYAIGGGPVEGQLTLGALLDLTQVARVGQAQLDLFQNEREEVNLAFDPRTTGEQPYIAFTTGDSVAVENEDDTFTAMRVRQIGGSVAQDTGDILWTLSVKDRVLEVNDRLLQWIKKMSNGALGGRSQPAQPVVSQPPKVRGLSAAVLGPLCYADSFNGPDGALGFDLTWYQNGDGVGIDGGQMAVTGTPTVGHIDVASIPVLYSGVGLMVSAVSAGTSVSTGLLIGGGGGVGGGISYGVVFVKLAGGAGWRLCYTNADYEFVYATGATTGTVWSLEWTSGDRLRAKIDGVLVADVAFTDAGFSGQPPETGGIMCTPQEDAGYTGGSPGAVWDDWRICATDAGGNASSVPPPA